MGYMWLCGHCRICSSLFDSTVLTHVCSCSTAYVTLSAAICFPLLYAYVYWILLYPVYIVCVLNLVCLNCIYVLVSPDMKCLSCFAPYILMDNFDISRCILHSRLLSRTVFLKLCCIGALLMFKELDGDPD